MSFVRSWGRWGCDGVCVDDGAHGLWCRMVVVVDAFDLAGANVIVVDLAMACVLVAADCWRVVVLSPSTSVVVVPMRCHCCRRGSRRA